MIARRLSLVRPSINGTAGRNLQLDVPLIASGGVAVVVALLVGSTAIGSGDYGQWLMVSRLFGGLSTPSYRDLSEVPPLVPTAIALLNGWLGDPILALHAVGFLIVAGMGGALYAAGSAVNGRAVTGLLAVVLGLLVSDQYLGLLAFGALLQATAIVFLTLAFAAFSRALGSTRTERRWWILGCVALFLACLTHVPTATIALPFCLAAATISVLPRDGLTLARRIRSAVPLGFGFAAISTYWLLVIAPASGAYATNPASLAYRGPDRLIELLTDYPPTLIIIVLGFVALAAWVARHVVRSDRPSLRDPRTVLLVWVGTSWAAFVLSALGGASTDYPRFAPLLVVPLVVVAADAIIGSAAALGRRIGRVAKADQGLVAIAVAVVLVAPFSIANYQTAAQGYRLPDDVSLGGVAAWADARLLPGKAILAPVREAKWIEGLTGRDALFATQIRYAFRPIEWERSLAANTLLRGDVALVNETFVLTMNDAVQTDDLAQPRGLLIASNHGGEYVDLLRLVPAASLVLDSSGRTLVSLPALGAAGYEREVGASRVAVTTRWSGVRDRSTVHFSETVDLAAGATSFRLDLRAASTGEIGGLRAELRAQSGVTITGMEHAGNAAIVTFARVGLTEPRLRVEVADGSITDGSSGGLILASSGRDLSVTVTDLTPGTASASLHMLESRAIVDAHGIGAVVLRRDPAYEDRRDRLEFLGFHVAYAEGPYTVMVRTGSARPIGP